MIQAVDTTKHNERQRLLQARSAVPTGQAQQWARAINSFLMEALDRLAPITVAVYLPIRNEPDLSPYYPDYAAKCRLALPVCADNGQLQFRSWAPGQPLQTGRYGIPVPVGADEVSPGLILLPCVGFNGAAYRLGYGGGWFDRTLAALPDSIIRWGVAYDCLASDAFTSEPHDVPLSAILTESGFKSPGSLNPPGPSNQGR